MFYISKPLTIYGKTFQEPIFKLKALNIGVTEKEHISPCNDGTEDVIVKWSEHLESTAVFSIYPDKISCQKRALPFSYKKITFESSKEFSTHSLIEQAFMALKFSEEEEGGGTIVEEL